MAAVKGLETCLRVAGAAAARPERFLRYCGVQPCSGREPPVPNRACAGATPPCARDSAVCGGPRDGRRPPRGRGALNSGETWGVRPSAFWSCETGFGFTGYAEAWVALEKKMPYFSASWIGTCLFKVKGPYRGCLRCLMLYDLLPQVQGTVRYNYV